MALSGKIASKVKGFMIEGIEELYKKESSSLSKDFTASKTTQQQMQQAQATTVTSADQLPIEATQQPQRSALREQVENLGLGTESETVTTGLPDPEDFAYKLPFYNDKNEAIKDATQMTEIAKKWEPQYKKAQAQGFTIPLYHWSKAGEEIVTDPREEGKGFLDPLLLIKSIRDRKDDTGDIGIHLGVPTAVKKMADKPEYQVDIESLEKNPIVPTLLPVVTKLDKVAMIPDMGRFKLPSEWLEKLSTLDITQNPTIMSRPKLGILRKSNLEADVAKNYDVIQNIFDEHGFSYDAPTGREGTNLVFRLYKNLKKYTDENNPFIFWPEDGNFVYLKNIEQFDELSEGRFNPLKNMSPILWRQLMEVAHKFHLKNIQATKEQFKIDVKKLRKEGKEPTISQKENADMFIPEKIHPSLIQEWYSALRKILEEGKYDAFAYPNYMEDQGALSYMFLDPRKIKSIFAKDFDPESFSFGKKSGGIVDMRNGGRVRR